MGTLKHLFSAASAPSTRTPRAITIASVCVFISAPVWSADIYETPIMDQTPAFSWSGAYVGAVGGYVFNKDQTHEVLGPFTFDYPYHYEGLSYGAKVGYNFDVNTFILGVEGDLEKSAATGGFYNAPSPGNPGGIGNDSTSWQGSIRARMGMTADRYMVFATAGYAFAQMKNAYTNPTSKVTESFDRFRDGLTVGGGIDYAATEHIIIGAEYRHTEFFPVTNVSTTAFPGATGRQIPISDAVRLSVSFKF